MLSVLRGDGTILNPASEISSSLKGRVADTDSLHYASKYNPAYTIDDTGVVNVYPTPTTNNNSPLNRLVIRIQDQNNYSESYKMLHTIKQILIASPGKDDIQLNIVKEDKETSLIWPTIKIDANPTLLAQISQILSKGDSVNIQEKLT